MLLQNSYKSIVDDFLVIQVRSSDPGLKNHDLVNLETSKQDVENIRQVHARASVLIHGAASLAQLHVKSCSGKKGHIIKVAVRKLYSYVIPLSAMIRSRLTLGMQPAFIST